VKTKERFRNGWSREPSAGGELRAVHVYMPPVSTLDTVVSRTGGVLESPDRG